MPTGLTGGHNGYQPNKQQPGGQDAQPNVLPPSPNIAAFMRSLVQLHVDAKKINWTDESIVIRINAVMLLDMLKKSITKC